MRSRPVLRRKVHVSVTVLLAAFLLGLGTGNDARADCVSAEAYFYVSGSSGRQYVAGPKRCVAPTPFSEAVHLRPEANRSEPPNGAPSGGGAAVWLPLP